MKQTAVDWLKVTVKAMIENGGDADLHAVLWHIEQAKAMEKEQMIDFAFKYGDLTTREIESSFDKEYKTNEK
jgi:hypothetical protein